MGTMNHLSDTPWATLLVFGLLIYLTYHIYIHPAFISPLSKIPNAHWSAPISPLWILHKRLMHREIATLVAAHKNLGPFIRVAPNEVIVDDLDAVKQIYVGGLNKPEWYGVFDSYGVPCMFSERTSKPHSLRKRMISHVYSKSFLHTSPSARAQATTIIHDRFLPALATAAASSPQQQRPINVYALFLATTTDFITAYLWGLARSTNFVQETPCAEHWLALYKARNNHAFFPQELPRLTAFCRRYLRLWLYPRCVDDANAELAAWNAEVCDRTMEDLATGGKTDGADDPVVMRALLAGLDKEAGRGGEEKSPIHATAVLRRQHTVHSELWDHVLAGVEGGAIALTYLTWHLSQDPALQAELRAELLTLHTAHGTVLPYARALDSLPLLHAVILETLRLHAPIPGPQPRETTAAASTQLRLGPYTVPGGVRVAALARTLHRAEAVFVEAERWAPRRWLVAEGQGEEERLTAMYRQFWAFSSGGRMCIGSNFAMQEMKLLAAAVYTNYTTSIADDTGIEQSDGYAGRPASEQLWVRFGKIGHSS